MSQKQQQSAHPMAPVNGHATSDTEAVAATHVTEAQRKKKNRTKCLLYIVLFAIFQAAVVAVFVTTVMRVRTPRFRVRSAAFENFNVGTPSNPSFSARMNAELSVRNNNFGRYKYRNTTVQFLYRGARVGEGFVHSSRVNWRSTRRFEVAADLRLGNAGADTELGRDLSAGVVPITSRARMAGRVELLFVIRRNRAATMNCSMEIVTATQQLRNIVCN